MARRACKPIVTTKGCYKPRRLQLRKATLHGRSVRLQCAAMQSLKKVYVELRSKNLELVVVSSYRSCAEQKAIYDSGVRPCARPGESYHNIGLAVDTYFRPAQATKIRAVFKKHGWHQFDTVNDPGHFTFHVTG